MEETRFDLLVRNAAQQTTRRKTLGTLFGGALLAASPGEIEATEKAQRRRKRKRRVARRRERAASRLLPIRVQIKNPGATEVNVHFVFLEDGLFNWICLERGRMPIPAGGEVVVQTFKRWTDALVWLNTTYSIEFWNPSLKTPAISAAVNGVSMNNRRHCPPRGTRALEHTAIPEGMSFEFAIYDKVFTVKRNWDTSYKEFTLTLPTNL